MTTFARKGIYIKANAYSSALRVIVFVNRTVGVVAHYDLKMSSE